jgi:two-component system, response regulator PdtaR
VTQVDAPARPTVVVAEDDVNARALIVELLDSLGYSVAAEVGTGQETVRLTRELQPDVVLLDVHMPEGGGIEAAEAIALANPGVAVVLYSGDPGATLSDSQVSSTAAVAFLPKPTPPTMLDATLRMAISRARQLVAARGDATAARAQLEQRKLIERAKGILMRRTGSSEQEAYRILQRSSQDRSVPMATIAQHVLDSEPGAKGNG